MINALKIKLFSALIFSILLISSCAEIRKIQGPDLQEPDDVTTVSLLDWAKEYSLDLDLYDLEDDIDSDGLSLLEEYALLVDPFKNQSSIPRTRIIFDEEKRVTLTHPVNTNSQVSHSLEASKNLRLWEKVPVNQKILQVPTEAYGLMEFKPKDIDFGRHDRYFFRIRINLVD